MNKQSIITILLALVALAGQGQQMVQREQSGVYSKYSESRQKKTGNQVKCHVVGSVAEGTTPVELRIYREGEDPKNSSLRLVLKEGRFECDVEDAQIERWHIVDFGEIMEKGMTLRSGMFFVEDGATVTIQLNDDMFDIQSTGKEYHAWHEMEQAAEAKFMPAYEKLDENDSAAMASLENDYQQWTLDYYKTHPMLGFLLELSERLKGFHYNDTGLATMIDIYHRQYTNLYTDHPVHQRIAEQEAKGYQMLGHKYSDYNVRSMDSKQVRASDYYKDKLTLVICWASWCAPCIRDACDIIPIYNKYRNRGLNVFSLAHEFKSTDAMRKAVELHAFPWPCLVDLDDEFGVFEKHGTANSALFLIDRDGTIIAVPNSVDELKAKLVEIFGE